MNLTDKERLSRWLDTLEKENVQNGLTKTETYFKVSEKENSYFEEYEFHDFLDLKKKIEQHISYGEKDASKILAVEIINNKPSLSNEDKPDERGAIELPDFVYVF